VVDGLLHGLSFLCAQKINYIAVAI
jgi:hypothetical protein